MRFLNSFGVKDKVALFEVFDEAERANFANLISKLSDYAVSLNK